MAVIEGGVTTSLLEVDTQHLAARVTQRPQDYGARGSYSFGSVTGVLPAALGANSEVVQFRFVHASFLCLIRSIRISASVSTTAFAAGVPIGVELRLATGWSGQGTGNNGITFGADDAKKRYSMASTVMGAGDLRVAATAALGAGTKTLQGQASAYVTGQPGTAVSTFIPANTPLWERNTADEYPMVFANQQGFVIRSVEVPATGTWKLSVNIEWTEIDPSAVSGW